MTADAMRDSIVRALGCDPAKGFRAALALLATKPALLVLDNLDTPWEPKKDRASTEDTLAELARIPGLVMLASFRGRNRVGGPPWKLVHLVGGLQEATSFQLFCHIAQKTFANDPHLPRFIRALDGIPLAIELVATRAHNRSSLAELWTQWTHVGVDLAARPDFDSGRLTSLPHSIELSLKSSRLTQAAHRLFSLLGQLPGGITTEDRDILLADVGFDAADVLLDLSLAVERLGRLDLLSPIRDHAARHHKPLAPDDTAWWPHYLMLTRRLGESIWTKTKAGEGAVARLAPEFPNIEASIRAALCAGNRPHAMDALWGLYRLALITGFPAAVLNDMAISCRDDADVLGEAHCLQVLGATMFRSDHAAARVALEKALQLYRQVGNLQGEASSTFSLGNVALERSDHAAAHAAYEQALELYRQCGNVHGEATCIESLGHIAARSDHEAARGAYVQALELYRQVRIVLGEANCIRALGDIALARSDHTAARAAYDQALGLYRQVGDIQGEGNCISCLGDIARERSDHAAAHAAYEQALQLFRQCGNVHGEANCVEGFGDIALAHLDYAAAHEAYERALPLYRQAGSVQGEAECFQRFADIALARSDHAAASRYYEQALPLYRHFGDLRGEANCIQGLGDIALARLDCAAAREAYERALPLYRQVGNVQGETTCIKKLGQLFGDPQPSASLDQFSDRLQKDPGLRLDVPAERKIGLMVNARGRMCLVYDQPFEAAPLWVAYHIDNKQIEIIFDNGGSYPIPSETTDKMHDSLMKRKKILIIRMENNKPVEGYETSFLRVREGKAIN